VEIERRALDALSRDDFEGMILIPLSKSARQLGRPLALALGRARIAGSEGEDSADRHLPSGDPDVERQAPPSQAGTARAAKPRHSATSQAPAGRAPSHGPSCLISMI
jgi:hypothetical protein